MCGYTGFTNHIDNSNRVIEDMMDQIRHRGPDAAGRYVDGDIALGHRRLSIIDITEQGDQPIYNEDRTKVLVFNGEIYNYQDIRKDLLAAGHVFRTQTDSEVLIHGYEEYGPELLPRLRGMFSFVIWDTVKKELFGARDFFGIKPLYYAVMGESFLFGSEIKSFLVHPHFKKELNETALENYLTFQYSPTEETFFSRTYTNCRLPIIYLRQRQADHQALLGGQVRCGQQTPTGGLGKRDLRHFPQFRPGA